MYCDKDHSDVTVDTLEALPKSQRALTGGRHRCAACAYEAGIAEGLRRARLAIEAIEAPKQ